MNENTNDVVILSSARRADAAHYARNSCCFLAGAEERSDEESQGPETLHCVQSDNRWASFKGEEP